MAAPWRLAKSLETLRSQVNALFPNRDKSNDGTIGDDRHRALVSDHNPDKNGVVRAMDISHDPDHGVGTYVLAEYLRLKRDPRILNVISNGRIWSSEVSPYKWRAYNKSNKHDKHIHISVVADPKKYDDTSPWDIAFSDTIPDPPPTALRAEIIAFQKAHGLEPDGIVGPATWAKLMELIKAGPTPDKGIFRAITATMFGGAADFNRSAYTNKLLNDVSLYVALPCRFKGARPKVKVTNPKTGASSIAAIEDVGPWMIDDDYWTSDRRPVAEACYLAKTPLPGGPNKGKVPTNPAGIDLSPALAKKLAIGGKGLVDWKFV